MWAEPIDNKNRLQGFSRINDERTKNTTIAVQITDVQVICIFSDKTQIYTYKFENI